MRLIRARVALAGSLLAVAGTMAGVVLAAGPASAGSSQVVLVNCSGGGQVRPAGYDIGCMPSSELVTGLKWTSWRSVAFGSGVLKVNDCTPTCAQGKYIKYPILTVLWRAAPWPKHPGQEYFSRLTWIFTSNRPGHVPTAQTFTLPSSGQP
jgi:hypothetical protein